MYHGGEHAVVCSLVFVSNEATTELNMNYLHNPGTLFVIHIFKYLLFVIAFTWKQNDLLNEFNILYM